MDWLELECCDVMRVRSMSLVVVSSNLYSLAFGVSNIELFIFDCIKVLDFYIYDSHKPF